MAWSEGGIAGEARTDSTGAYTIDHLPNGSYIVLAKDEHDFVPTFYNASGGTPFLDSAASVAVTGGAVNDITIYVETDSVDGLNSVGGTVAVGTSGSSLSRLASIRF